jgi:predicted phage baseplate assembly protein
MPIEQHIPKIDNRRFEDILAEVRTRIPRYTPEWTDFNDTDPGITLAQLFAWMCDLLLYRMALVPELNYLKFLQLIGIELAPAQSATADVTFPVKPTFTDAFTVVPMLTQISAQSPDGTTPIVFETERPLFALRASLAAVQILDGYSFFDITEANTNADVGFEPFGPAAAQDSALMLGFDFDDAFPEVELNLAVFAVEAASSENFVSCGLPAAQLITTSQVSWEYWNGSEWRKLSLLKDDTQAFLRSGHIYLKTPPAGSMAKAVIGTVPTSLFWIRARLLRSAFDRVPEILAIRTNTVEARQAETVSDEVLGGSTGEPNQVVRLVHAPVLSDTLVVEIDEGSGSEVWTEVPDFFGSSAQDRVYVLNATTGEVRFGDGTLGAIPVANVENSTANIVARSYRFGGGKLGNVAARAINTLVTTVTGVADDGVGNLLAAVNGRDEQSIDDAKQRAALVLRSQSRAVTVQDFEELARQAGNVRRAKALPLYHPRFPEARIPGVVTVVVVPDNDLPNPMPSEGTIRSVCDYLNQRRLLTAEVYVIPPTYMEVQIVVEAIAADTADAADLKLAIEESLVTYFHPLKGGDDGLGWPFGGDIFFSKVYGRVLSVPGVQRVQKLLIRLDGEEAPECRDVPIPGVALLFSTTHEVQVNYEFGE